MSSAKIIKAKFTDPEKELNVNFINTLHFLIECISLWVKYTIKRYLKQT